MDLELQFVVHPRGRVDGKTPFHAAAQRQVDQNRSHLELLTIVVIGSLGALSPLDPLELDLPQDDLHALDDQGIGVGIGERLGIGGTEETGRGYRGGAGGERQRQPRVARAGTGPAGREGREEEKGQKGAGHGQCSVRGFGFVMRLPLARSVSSPRHHAEMP